jgi:acyl carrier protein
MDIEQELQTILKKKLKGDFSATASLTDAGLDSLDIIELAFDVEDKFDIQFPQIGKEMMSLTFGDLTRLVEQQLAVKSNATVVNSKSWNAAPS